MLVLDHLELQLVVVRTQSQSGLNNMHLHSDLESQKILACDSRAHTLFPFNHSCKSRSDHVRFTTRFGQQP